MPEKGCGKTFNMPNTVRFLFVRLLALLFILSSGVSVNAASFDTTNLFVVLNNSNEFYASPDLPPVAVKALDDAKSRNDDIQSFTFTPKGGWILFDKNGGYETSDDGLPDKAKDKNDWPRRLNKSVRNFSFSPGNAWLILYQGKGYFGTGSPAFNKVQELLKQGHTVRSVSFGPGNDFVVLYDQTGISHGDVPKGLAKVLDDATTQNISLQCVAFCGRDWVCLAQDEWWTSDTNLLAAKVIEDDYQNGRHPRWIAFVPRQPQPDEISEEDFPRHDFQAWPAQIQAHFSRNTVGGYALLARYNGKIVVSRVGGYARMPYEKEGAATRWTAYTAMHVASVSKPITGTALMKLWEEKSKSFSFDGPFWPYVSDLFPDATEQSRQITLRQLMNHKSGLRESESVKSPLKDTAHALACPTNSAPGTLGFYNNMNYYLVRLVIEKISGEPYTQYVRNHVLIPCGAVHMDTKHDEPLPLLCYISKGQTNLPGNIMSDFTASAGAFGWYASSLELSAFVYGASSGKIISKNTSQFMFRNGFGWFPINSGDQIVGYAHNGGWTWSWTDSSVSTGGHASSLAIHFLDGVDVVVLVNSDQGGDLGKLLSDLWLGKVEQ